MAAPATAVVVLTWNGRANLERLLPTLVTSDHPDLRILVVDNASRDGTADWVAANYPECILVRNDANLRFAGGNNRGAERAAAEGAEVVVLLNDDTTVRSDSLRRLTEPFAADPGLGIAGPRICHLDAPERIWFGGGELAWWTGWVGHRALRRDIDAGADPAGPTDWVTGCALAVRAEVWRDLGGLDEGYYIYTEDVDFCVRARRAGWRLTYVPESTVLHAVSASTGGQDSGFKAYHKTRSRWQLLRRHARPWHWPVLLPSWALQEGALWLRDRVAGRARAAAGRALAWRDLDGRTNRFPTPPEPGDLR